MANPYCINFKKLEVNQNNEGTSVHPLVALMFAVAVGGLFVVFLPFIGLYLAGKQLFKVAGAPIRALFTTAVAPQAAPGMSYMDGSGRGESPAAKSTLENLEKEIEAAKNNK